MIPNCSYLKTMRPNYFMYQKLSLKINNQHIHKHIFVCSQLIGIRSSEMNQTSMFNMIRNKLPWNNLNIITFNTFHCHCQSYYNINRINWQYFLEEKIIKSEHWLRAIFPLIMSSDSFLTWFGNQQNASDSNKISQYLDDTTLGQAK